MNKKVTIEDIKELLSNLGISIYETDANNFVIADDDNGEEMNAYITSNPLLLIPENEVKTLSSIRDMTKEREFIILSSKNKFIKYHITPKRRPNGESISYISEIYYYRKSPDDVIEKTIASFSSDKRMKLSTIVYSGITSEIIERKEIRTDVDESISFEINGRIGYFADGDFEEGWDLEKSEMEEELKSNNLITILAEGSKKQFPIILDTINKAKEKTKSNTK